MEKPNTDYFYGQTRQMEHIPLKQNMGYNPTIFWAILLVIMLRIFLLCLIQEVAVEL